MDSGVAGGPKNSLHAKNSSSSFEVQVSSTPELGTLGDKNLQFLQDKKEPNALSLLVFSSLIKAPLPCCANSPEPFPALQNQPRAIKPGEDEHQFPPIDFGIKELFISILWG